jgi:hypothetical protein
VGLLGNLLPLMSLLLMHGWVDGIQQAFLNPALRQAGATLKDGDLHEKLYLAPTRRADLMYRLDKDAKFLEGKQIMDYSVRSQLSWVVGRRRNGLRD